MEMQHILDETDFKTFMDDDSGIDSPREVQAYEHGLSVDQGVHFFLSYCSTLINTLNEGGQTGSFAQERPAPHDIYRSSRSDLGSFERMQ